MGQRSQHADRRRPIVASAGRPGRAWLIACLVAVPYFITNVVAMLNATGDADGTVWLPSFPAWYYSMQRIIEKPFGWYFSYMQQHYGGEDGSYQAFTWKTRAPFVVVSVIIFVAAAVRSPRTLPPPDLHPLS